MNNWINIRRSSIVAMLMAGAVALSACGGATAKSNADLIKAAAANMKAAKSYTLTANVTQGDQAVKLDGMFDLAGNNTKMNVETGGQKISVITVGNDVYLSQDGGTTYTKTDQGASIVSGFSSFTKMWDSFNADQVDKVKDSLKDGTPATEKIDGVDTKHITANAKDLALSPGSSTNTTDGTIDLWISTDKEYVRQMKINGTSNGQTVNGTLNWSQFDTPFNIKAPPTSFKLNVSAFANR